MMRIGSLAAAMLVGLLVVAGGCSSGRRPAPPPLAENAIAPAPDEGAAPETTAAVTTGQSAAPKTPAPAAPAQSAPAEAPKQVAAAETPPEPEPAAAPKADGNTILMQLDSGTVTIKLRPDLAPNHAERLKALTKRGFYDGVVFHRVIPGFMAQTGDPTGTGTGGSDLPDLKAEFSKESFKRGVIGMARTGDPNSANSQFFITYADSPWLNGQYTVVGEVVDGMDAVDAVKKGSEANNGLVQDPDKIISMKMAQ